MSIIARLLNQRLNNVERELDRLQSDANELRDQLRGLEKQMDPLFAERVELNAALLESSTHAQQEL